jgi:FKBP12-rapamycin complex-associated protein
MYRPRNRSSAFPTTKAEEQEAKEVQNARAIQVLARVKEKLTGMDFPMKDRAQGNTAAAAAAVTNSSGLTVPAVAGPTTPGGQQPTPAGEIELRVDVQVDRLIREATNLENLCQHYIGWCSFW